MRMWQPASCFPISVLFTFITSVKILLIYRRHASLSIAEVDFLSLCEHKVHDIEDLTNGGNLLNKRQCLDLSAKLSKAFKNIKELVSHCGASSTVVFRPALENLYRTLEKAKLLVSNCCHEDWCASSVFQIQNEKAFHEILLELRLCYNAIYEQAKGTSIEWNSELEDLRKSPTFQHASTTDVEDDNETLQRWLEDLASEYNRSRLSILDRFLPGRFGLKQSLARYLLAKLRCVSQHLPQGKDKEKSTGAIMLTEDTQPSGTWRGECFLGAGSGAEVWSAKWLGIPCAKKVFQGININETCSFSKEAGILAHLNHPRVVKFFCCGSGQKNRDGFIAMELMEMSLYDLIRNQTEPFPRPFPLPVAVDIIMQIARGMCYLHEVMVAHRDLKPQNVVVNRLSYPHLVDDYFCVKLVDFGLSKTKVEVHRAHTISVCGVGTTIYRAPEVYPQAHLGGELGKAMWFKADVYSFAVTCAEILTLQPPYKNVSKISKLYDELIKGLRPELPVECPQELVSLLTDCWDPIPSSRPSFSQICKRLEAFSHKFIWMKMEEPSSLQRQFIAKTDDDEIESHSGLLLDSQEMTLGRSSSVTVSPGGSLGGGSKEVKPFIEDPDKEAQVLTNNLSEKLTIVPSSNGESSRASKPKRRGHNNKTGIDKPPKGEAKKISTEVPLHQSNSGEGKKTKESNCRKIDDCDTPTGNVKKRSKRKQALDDPTTGAPVVKSRNEVPIMELKKRPRRDADEKLGEGPSMTKARTLGASWSEELARTLSEGRGSFEPHSWHICNRDGGEVLTLEFIKPAQKKPGRNGRKNPWKKRVKSISAGCPPIC